MRYNTISIQLAFYRGGKIESETRSINKCKNEKLYLHIPLARLNEVGFEDFALAYAPDETEIVQAQDALAIMERWHKGGALAEGQAICESSLSVQRKSGIYLSRTDAEPCSTALVMYSTIKGLDDEGRDGRTILHRVCFVPLQSKTLPLSTARKVFDSCLADDPMQAWLRKGVERLG